MKLILPFSSQKKEYRKLKSPLQSKAINHASKFAGKQTKGKDFPHALVIYLQQLWQLLYSGGRDLMEQHSQCGWWSATCLVCVLSREVGVLLWNTVNVKTVDVKTLALSTLQQVLFVSSVKN